jgi:hypothetical protein
VVGRLGDTPFSDVDTAAGWQDNIHHSQVVQFLQHTAWLVAESCVLTHLAKRLPQHVRQETDEDVSEDTVFFLVPDRANLEIALMDAEGRFRVPIIIPPKITL